MKEQIYVVPPELIKAALEYYKNRQTIRIDPAQYQVRQIKFSRAELAQLEKMADKKFIRKLIKEMRYGLYRVRKNKPACLECK